MEPIPKEKKPNNMIVFLPTLLRTKEAIKVAMVLAIEMKEDMRWPSYPEISLTEIASQ